MYCVNGCTGRSNRRLKATRRDLCDRCFYGPCACGNWASKVNENGQSVCGRCYFGRCACGKVGNSRGPSGEPTCNQCKMGRCACGKIANRLNENGEPSCNEHRLGRCAAPDCRSQASQLVPEKGVYYCSVHYARGPEAKPRTGAERHDAPHYLYLIEFPDFDAVKVGISCVPGRPEDLAKRCNGRVFAKTEYVYDGHLAARRVERGILRTWTETYGARKVPLSGSGHLDDGRDEWRRPGDLYGSDVLLAHALDVLGPCSRLTE